MACLPALGCVLLTAAHDSFAAAIACCRHCCVRLLLPLPVILPRRGLTKRLMRLLDPECGFAAEGDAAAAVAGLSSSPAGGEPSAAAAAAAAGALRLPTNGVLRACYRAAMAHRLYVKRLLPRLQDQGLLPLLAGLEMPMVHVLAGMEHHGIAFSSAALTAQLPPMEQRLQQLQAQAARYIQAGNVDKVLWNKERGSDALSALLYGPAEAGGLGLVPPVETARSA